MFLTPEYILQDMPVDFFDFQFTMNADGTLSDANGKSHTSSVGTQFRDIMTVSDGNVSSWREHYVGWGQKQIRLIAKNVTVTKVTIYKQNHDFSNSK